MTDLSKDEVVKPDDFKFKHADLLNRLHEMQRSPYYATACHTLIQAEMAIVGLEQDIAPLVAEVERLKSDLEQTQVQLAGCGVAAMQNTEGSKAHRVERGAYGWSDSYGDVCRMVDREIELRADLVAEIETLRYELDAVAEIKQERDALRAELGQYPEIQAMLMSENKQLRAEVEAFDKAEDSWMCKAIESEAEVAKLRGLVSGRSAEYLAAHITYDKGYQEGRLDAESLNIPVAEVGVSIFTWLGDRPPAGTTLYRIDQL